MQFSLLNAVRNHPDSAYPEVDVYADYISDAVLAEELGFTRAWFGEHHFRPCQWTGSPIQVCTAVAARTEHLRVGTAVALLPFHDPIRLAEDIAVCDILSRGRFDFGFGPGSQYEEFNTFGVDPKEMNGRMWESIDWILEALASEGSFSHHGAYYDIPDMTFTTKPVQPRIPVWSSAMGPMNKAKAAARGFNFIGPFNIGWDEAFAAAGREPAEANVASMQMVHVTDDVERGWSEAGQALEYFVNFYETRLDLQGNESQNQPVTADMIRSGNAGFWSANVGTPDDVIAGLTPFVDGTMGRNTELAVAFRHAGMRTPEVHASMRMFAADVMPALTELAVY